MSLKQHMEVPRGGVQSWLKEEDEQLGKLVKELIAKTGPDKLVKWSMIAPNLKNRSSKQCRERWLNHLNPRVRKGEWSAKEEAIFLDAHHKLGNSWSDIAKLLPASSDNSIKNHWNSALRRMGPASSVRRAASSGEKGPGEESLGQKTQASEALEKYAKEFTAVHCKDRKSAHKLLDATDNAVTQRLTHLQVNTSLPPPPPPPPLSPPSEKPDSPDPGSESVIGAPTDQAMVIELPDGSKVEISRKATTPPKKRKLQVGLTVAITNASDMPPPPHGNPVKRQRGKAVTFDSTAMQPARRCSLSPLTSPLQGDKVNSFWVTSPSPRLNGNWETPATGWFSPLTPFPVSSPGENDDECIGIGKSGMPSPAWSDSSCSPIADCLMEMMLEERTEAIRASTAPIVEGSGFTPRQATLPYDLSEMLPTSRPVDFDKMLCSPMGSMVACC